MPDIARTITQALALLPDNIKGDISPQDLRDVVMTLFPDHMYAHSLTDDFTATLQPSVFQLLNTGMVLDTARNFALVGPTNYAFRYTGAPKRLVLAVFVIIGNSGTYPESVAYRLRKNGVDLTPGVLHFASTRDNNEAFETVYVAGVEMVTNDVLQMALAGAGGGAVGYSIQSQEVIAIGLPALT